MKKENKFEFFIPKKENGIGQWLAEEGISAGFPSPADDFKETRISLDRELVKNKEATYFCSDLRLDVLPSYLKEKGILLNEVEVYKTMLSPVKIHEDISGVLFFSPSGIESYLEVNDTNKIAFCIGETTAVQARKYFETVQVANLPSVENLLESLNTYFSK